MRGVADDKKPVYIFCVPLVALRTQFVDLLTAHGFKATVLVGGLDARMAYIRNGTYTMWS